MQLTVTGKQIDVGDALRRHVEASLSTILGKYFRTAIEAHAVFSREAHLIRAEISLRIGRGIVINSGAAASDHYLAFDAADMVDINHHALADPSDDGRYQSRASRRNVGGLARIFVAILKHEAAEQVYPDALKAPSVMPAHEGTLAERLRQGHLVLKPGGKCGETCRQSRALRLTSGNVYDQRSRKR